MIKYIVLHCTAGPQHQSTQEIFNYWQRVNKWKNVGYHFDINADGTIEQLMEISGVANGVAGYNSNSIHVCYKGGIDASGKPVDNRTPSQIKSQILIVSRLKELFPNTVVLGHRDFSRDQNGNGIIDRWEWIKSCPAFDVRDWLKSMLLEPSARPNRIVYKLNTPLVKDSNVGIIQKALSFAGYPIKIDNYFGAETDKYVRMFQKAKGLTVDGIVGKNTQKKLKISL